MPRADHDLTTGVPMALTSIISLQFGAAIAVQLFSRIGPLGAVSLRLAGASIVLLLAVRPWRTRWTRADLGVTALFGVVLATMNSLVYIALSRLPLGTAITLEVLGPLALTVATAGGWRMRRWVVPAALGVVLLGGTLHLSDVPGVAAILGAAALWACYILLSHRVGQRTAGLTGLAAANTVGAVLIIPIGAATAGMAILRPATLALGLAVGVLSSAVPYSFDLLALRRIPPAVFGVLTSLNPAVAALAGLLLLGQRLPLIGFVAVGLVVVASAGVTLSASRSRVAGLVTAADVAP